MNTLQAEEPVTGGDGLGRAIHLRRVELGLKRPELAKRANLSYPYVSEIENGMKNPSTKALRQLADALDLSSAELMDLADRVAEGSAIDAGSVLGEFHAGARPVDNAEMGQRRAWQTFHATEHHLASASSVRSAAEAELLDRASQIAVAAVVRAEIAAWARSELPALIRAELDRTVRRGQD